MDEKTLSTSAVEQQHIEAICFYSGLGNGNGGTDYVTRTQYPSLLDVKNAIDNSVSDAIYLKVANELSPRRFVYGELNGKLVLVETVLLTLNIMPETFSPLNMRAASWRNQVQQPVVA